jgi:succinate dehydrogenase / fumarate reductase cytochrome b subunit
MSEAARRLPERPTSPHLTVWRWHATMLSSILHRMSGCALYAGALILGGWAIALAMGPDAYAAYMAVLGGLLGKIVLLGLTAAIFYHTANGIRHLVWDAGKAFDPKFSDLTAVVVIAFTVAATAAVWILAAMTGSL